MSRFLTLILAIIFATSSGFAKKNISKNEVLEIISLVNNHWQDNHPDEGNAFWDNAAYHTGNMEAYKVTKTEKFRNYSKKWAEKNLWQGATGNNPSKWKYKNYGESADYVLFGDWQACFQTYIDLYNLAPESVKIARARQVMQYEMSTPNNDFWWWADALYMVMPVMTKLYNVTGDTLYLDKLNEYFTYSANLMYDAETGLFFRDAKYVFPNHKTINGKKDFWARGNGWVFAALAKVLNDMPQNCKYRNKFENYYLNMAKALVKYQQKQGYWSRSIMDSKQAPGYETSGTAFFTYGLLWGINNGYLKDKKYTKSALRGWKYLSKTALQPDGTIGYVQPIGEKAIPDQVVSATSTANFGVGAFLLAASEMVRYLEKSR